MKWFIVVVFNTFPGDVYIFHQPSFDDRKTCLVTLWESRDAVLQKLMEEYGKPMPIEAVNCLTEEVIKKVIENAMADSVNNTQYTRPMGNTDPQV